MSKQAVPSRNAPHKNCPLAKTHYAQKSKVEKLRFSLSISNTTTRPQEAKLQGIKSAETET